jgi:hypothetical protein
VCKHCQWDRSDNPISWVKQCLGVLEQVYSLIHPIVCEWDTPTPDCIYSSLLTGHTLDSFD